MLKKYETVSAVKRAIANELKKEGFKKSTTSFNRKIRGGYYEVYEGYEFVKMGNDHEIHLNKMNEEKIQKLIAVLEGLGVVIKHYAGVRYDLKNLNDFLK